MSQIDIDKSQIPLWKGATGKFQAEVNVPAPNQPLPVSASAIAGVSFSADGQAAIGKDVSIGVSAQTSLTLAALFQEQTGADPALVSEFNLGPVMGPDNLLLALDVGGKADVSVAGSYTYNVLSVGATLKAGGDARLVHVRRYPRTEAAGNILLDFFGNLALPGTISVPPPPGQVTSFEYGGYLNFGVNASAGYQLKGTKDFQNIAGLNLSEHYQFSATGKLSVNAKLAGRFSVCVQAADDDHWARVTVKRSRSKDLQIAADLSVGAQLDTQGLPSSGKEFLGALLGVRAKNWINQADSILQQAAAIKTPQDLINKLDGLAQTYVSQYVGKAVDEFLPQDVVDLMGRVKKIVDSYNQVGDRAVALFDRYFNIAQTKLVDVLTQINKLASFDQFQGEVDPVLWNVVQQLTGGNILDLILQKTAGLATLQQGAQQVLSLIQSDAHQEIRNFITVAEQKLDLDKIVPEIAKFDTPDGLKTQLSSFAQGVVSRIIGKAVSQINSDDFKAITGFIQQVQKGEQGFFAKFDQILQEAASQSFSMDIGLAYARSDDSNALVDVDIRLQNDDAGRTANATGQRLLQSAGLGDFSEILANYNPAIVKLRQGSLTHNLSTSSGLTINIAGWHSMFQYSDMHKVVVNSDQQIRSTPSGMLNVFTTVDMSAQHDQTRKTSKSEQEMHSNFTLRFLAQTNTTITDSKFDEDDRQYLLDVITGQAATYSNTLVDSNTTPDKLDHMLAFAATLGLDEKGANRSALQPVLQLQNGTFGPVTAEYQVQFTAQGLASLFQPGAAPVTADQISATLRRIVISEYAGDAGLAPVGWLFCSDRVRELALGNPNFLDTTSVLQDAMANGEVKIAVPFQGMKPVVSNQPVIRQLVATLFRMEQSLIDAFLNLQSLVQKPSIQLSDLEKASQKFGSALNSFESQTQLSATAASPTFAVFDGLIQLATPEREARDSALSLKVGPAATQHQLLFQLAAGPAVAAASR